MTKTYYHDPDQIRRACARVKGLPIGDAAEVGVYRGEGAKCIAEALPGVTVHLFDTFCGMPALIQHGDWHKVGDFKDTSVPRVVEALNGYPIVVHQGLFPETAVAVPLRFVHVDCDLYRSTMDAMVWAWNNLVPGGIILCDDYNCASCPNAKRAINEWMVKVGAEGEFENRFARFMKPGGVT